MKRYKDHKTEQRASALEEQLKEQLAQKEEMCIRDRTQAPRSGEDRHRVGFISALTER